MIIKVGKNISFKKKISKDLIKKFSKLSGDNNPIHINEKYVSKTAYKKIVAHGMLSETYLSKIIGTKLPGKGSLWVEKEVKYLKIVRVNDVITFKANVEEIDEKNRIAFINIYGLNQYGEKVINSNNKVIIPENCKIDSKKTVKKEKNIIKIKNIKNKTILVLGASGGIGFEIVKKFLKSGYIVHCQYFSEKKNLYKLKKKFKDKIFIHHLDIKSNISLLKFFKSIKKIKFTHLINCIIPKIYNKEFINVTKRDYEYYFSKLFFNIVEIINKISKKFIENKNGNIIDVSTVFLKIPERNFLPYITYKGAMKSFIKTLSIELSGYNIRVNIITAGVTETNQISNMTKKQKMLIAARTPLKRIASVRDIANAAKFLASEDSSFINAADLNVDGGIV